LITQFISSSFLNVNNDRPKAKERMCLREGEIKAESARVARYKKLKRPDCFQK